MAVGNNVGKTHRIWLKDRPQSSRDPFLQVSHKTDPDARAARSWQVKAPSTAPPTHGTSKLQAQRRQAHTHANNTTRNIENVTNIKNVIDPKEFMELVELTRRIYQEFIGI